MEATHPSLLPPELRDGTITGASGFQTAGQESAALEHPAGLLGFTQRVHVALWY